MGLGRETFENVGRVFVNVWAVEYFYSMVGVLNSLETNKQAPHIYSMEALQALDNTEVFQKPKVHPRQIIAQSTSVNGGRQRESEEMTLVQDPKKPQGPRLFLPLAVVSLKVKNNIIVPTLWSCFDDENVKNVCKVLSTMPDT